MNDDLMELAMQRLPPGTPISILVDFSLPFAQRLSDLTGIDADLKSIESICKRLQADEGMDVNALTDGIAYMNGLTLRDALFDAAVIKYGRTKATGARAGLPSGWFGKLPPHLKKFICMFRIFEINL